jgi:anti-anti-sigma factor
VSNEDGTTSGAAESRSASFPVQDVQGCAVVVASGEIDLDTAPALRAALNAATERSCRIVLDLTAVTFLDSSGLSVIAGAQHLSGAGDGDGSLCLVDPAPIVRRVLDITRVSQLFPICDSVSEAVDRLA